MLLQLLANDDPGGLVGKPSILRGGFGSLLVHGVVAVALVAALEFAPAVLPEQFTRIALIAPAPPAPPPPPAPVGKAAQVVTRRARMFSLALTAPSVIPQHAAEIAELDAPELELGGVVGGIPGGMPGGVLGGVVGGIGPAIAPPEPPKVQVKEPEPPALAPQLPDRIEVDSEIQAGKILTMVQPEYPPIARQARIQGDVHLKAIIDRDGKVCELQVLDGNALLVGAARRAVERWRYRPTLLHGQPVEVVTNIVVMFRLRRPA